jgi:hypothetical protein
MMVQGAIRVVDQVGSSRAPVQSPEPTAGDPVRIGRDTPTDRIPAL